MASLMFQPPKLEEGGLYQALSPLLQAYQARQMMRMEDTMQQRQQERAHRFEMEKLNWQRVLEEETQKRAMAHSETMFEKGQEAELDQFKRETAKDAANNGIESLFALRKEGKLPDELIAGKVYGIVANTPLSDLSPSYIDQLRATAPDAAKLVENKANEEVLANDGDLSKVSDFTYAWKTGKTREEMALEKRKVAATEATAAAALLGKAETAEDVAERKRKALESLFTTTQARREFTASVREGKLEMDDPAVQDELRRLDQDVAASMAYATEQGVNLSAYAVPTPVAPDLDAQKKLGQHFSAGGGEKPTKKTEPPKPAVGMNIWQMSR